MGIKKFFKRGGKRLPDPVSGLSLSNLKSGYLVDYDLKTWEVTAYSYYDWGGGDISHEWQLKSSDGEVAYLEKESDDEDEWSLNRKVPFHRLDPEITEKIQKTGDAPDTIVFDGTTYYMEEMAGGHFFKDGLGPGKELLRWSYDNDEDGYLGIEQWGENDFDATVGEPVEEYQFTNILPHVQD